MEKKRHINVNIFKLYLNVFKTKTFKGQSSDYIRRMCGNPKIRINSGKPKMFTSQELKLFNPVIFFAQLTILHVPLSSEGLKRN